MTEETAGLDKLERDVRYRDAMKQIHLAYADDLEARVFYGLSMLGVGSVNRDYAVTFERRLSLGRSGMRIDHILAQLIT